MAPPMKSQAEAAEEEQGLPYIPNELLHMIFKLAIEPSDSDEKFFWFIRGDGEDQPHLVEPKSPIRLDWDHVSKGGTVECSKHKLRTQHETYASIRGDTIRNLLLVSKYVKYLVEREYVFLMPFKLVPYACPSKLVPNARPSAPGFWVHPEHDIFQLLDSRSPMPIVPSPSSAFPWSRVRNVHIAYGFHRPPFASIYPPREVGIHDSVYPWLSWGDNALWVYQEIYSFAPNLETIFVDTVRTIQDGLITGNGGLRPVPISIARYMSAEQEAVRKGKRHSLVAAHCLSLPDHHVHGRTTPNYRQTLEWARSHRIEILEIDSWHRGFKSGYVCQSII
ncbi:hypothetical protein EKO27_g9526 [Xylaria grammica]|uniref:Uncharacterized protein n=1 Tax=Xylaria grammica TaxID=363999 RepID=A0A439CTS5_9PEZI|nr:hypothetical protein EKO27_g9526 [Xylaria grammica]